MTITTGLFMLLLATSGGTATPETHVPLASTSMTDTTSREGNSQIVAPGDGEVLSEEEYLRNKRNAPH